jgi:hypothetical protein
VNGANLALVLKASAVAVLTDEVVQLTNVRALDLGISV